MTDAGPTRSLGARARRALVVFVGAAALGPTLPALVFFAMAAIGGRLEGARTSPIQSIPTVASSALSFAFVDGGGATAALSGLLLAALMLWKGAIGPIAATRTVAFVAVLVSLWIVRTGTLRGALALTVAFVLAAVVTAQALYRLAASWRILP